MIPDEKPRASLPPTKVPAAAFAPENVAFDVVTLALPAINWLTISVTVTVPPDRGDTATCALAWNAKRIAEPQIKRACMNFT
jgi:hypothetical protein